MLHWKTGKSYYLKKLIQQHARVTFQDLYSPATFQHVTVVAASISREVHLHEPKHAFVGYLIMHTVRFTSLPHQYSACWTQISNTPEAAEHHGNPESSSWHILVCVRERACVLMYVTPPRTFWRGRLYRRVCISVGSRGPFKWCIHLC
jgi:hypothetical protein